ncbi:hypothetical protein K7472_08185 [Streptomyces sp. PTM05]|uniref:Uncharacterized protein n=1 Tax=Streptantibioticus parmotrematis TaxID=2873249 RepID=A0ABS7QQ83_9ACTN|nr:DUF6349 family protein [Streptantibioticus parmotrematis]MBY8884824.1 hypothetical protein [Streptantibioticus parmotrematis]
MTTPSREPRGAVARHTAYLTQFWDKTKDSRPTWHIDWGHAGFDIHTPPEPTSGHRPTLLARSWERPAPDGSGETWSYLHRGACLGCTWEGPNRRGTDEAIEDAHDHSHPGWRALPAVLERRSRHWFTHVQRLYPAGWFDRGGPIRTVRTGIEKQHKPGAAPGGGYDLATQAPERQRRTAIAEPLPLDANEPEAA